MFDNKITGCRNTRMLLTDKMFHVPPFPLLLLNDVNNLLLIMTCLWKCKERAIINDSTIHVKKVDTFFLFFLYTYTSLSRSNPFSYLISSHYNINYAWLTVYLWFKLYQLPKSFMAYYLISILLSNVENIHIFLLKLILSKLIRYITIARSNMKPITGSKWVWSSVGYSP